jgi:hypothetical protein
LKGVNRHEHWSDVGHAITEEQMIRDLQVIKQGNCNHVRTCHYSDDPRWYELCDEWAFGWLPKRIANVMVTTDDLMRAIDEGSYYQPKCGQCGKFQESSFGHYLVAGQRMRRGWYKFRGSHEYG